MRTFRLRFPERDLRHWASRYPAAEDVSVEQMGSGARARSWLTRREFLALCRWKTPRSQPICRRNSDRLVRETTRLALAARDEELKVALLRELAGVGWPTASVILHFCDRAPYPILDVRALWTAGFGRPPAYTIDLWARYTAFARDLSRRTGCSVREVDRALWQYSKAKQR